MTEWSRSYFVFALIFTFNLDEENFKITATIFKTEIKIFNLKNIFFYDISIFLGSRDHQNLMTVKNGMTILMNPMKIVVINPGVHGSNKVTEDAALAIPMDFVFPTD